MAKANQKARGTKERSEKESRMKQNPGYWPLDMNSQYQSRRKEGAKRQRLVY